MFFKKFLTPEVQYDKLEKNICRREVMNFWEKVKKDLQKGIKDRMERQGVQNLRQK